MTAWAQFDQLLTCAICLDRFRNPKLLPCQHTFCMEPCLDGLIDYVRRQIKCPECRAEHRIPYKGIQEFPTNVTLMRFLELHREVTGEEPEPPPCMMERCAVCTEKSFCEKCAHCGKKVCEECKEAHMDIMKREIVRINHQVKRSMTRLTDALSMVIKNSQAIEQNTFNLKDEIEDLSRRLEKDLKDKEKILLDEIEGFKTSEEKSIQEMKENLEQEIENLNSNCDLCEQHINDKVDWTDAELVEYKECFLKMLEFLRNFDVETADSGQRRLKLIYKMDPHLLHQNVKAFAEIKTNDPNVQNIANIAQSTTLQVPGGGSGQGSQNALMRSQSDHRLAAQFQRSQRPETARSMLDVSQKYGNMASDSDRDKESPLSSRRGTYGVDSSSSSRYSRYGERSSTRDLDEVKSGSRYGKDDYSSRNWRDRDDEVVTLRESFRQRYGLDPPSEPPEDAQQGRTVRFAQEDTPQPPLERLFECESAKGPLSGIVRLIDCPKLQERLHQKQKKTKVDEAERTKKAEQKVVQQQQAPPPSFNKKPPNRQTSEDEIEKQKRINKENAAALTAAAAANSESARPLSRRVAALQKEEDSRSRRAQDESESDLDPVRRSKPTSDESQNETTPSRRSSRDDTASPVGGRTSPADSTASSRQGTPTRRKPFSRNQSFERPGHTRNSSTGGTYSPIDEQDRSSDSESEVAPVSNVDSTRRVKDEGRERKRRSANYSRTSSNSSLNLTSHESHDEDARRDIDVATPTTPPLASPFFRRTKATTTPPPPVTANPISSVLGNSSHSSGTSTLDGQRSRSLSKTRSLDQPEDSASSFRSKFSSLGRTPSTDINPSPGRATQGGFTSRFLPRQATVEDKSETETETDSEDSDEDDDKVSTIRRKRSDTANPALNALLVRAANARSATKPEDEPDKSKSYTSRFQSAYARNKERSERPSSSQGNYRSYGDDDQGPAADDDYVRRYSTSGSRPASSPSRRHGVSSRTNDDDSASPYNRYLSKSRSSAALGGMTRDTSPSRSSDRFRKGSRFSAVRNQVGRSKSSHDIWAEDSGDDDYKPKFHDRSAYRRRSSEKSIGTSALTRSRSNHAIKSREASLDDDEDGSTTATTTSSPWAKYLRSKYRNQRSSSSGGSSSVVGRSKSSGALYSRDDSDDGDAHNGTSSQRGSIYNRDSSMSLSYGRISENPRTMYLQKRRMVMKIGSRGSDKGYFTWPRGVAVGPENIVVVADSSNHRVQIFDSNGRFLKEFGNYGSGEGEFDCLAGVAVNRIGQFIISDRYNHRIQVFDPSGRFLRSFGCEGRGDGRFSYPWGIATDSLGFIYVCDKENHRVQVFQADGTFVGKFGSIGNRPGQLEHPHYIAVSSTNRVIVSDSNNHRIQVFDVNGRCVSAFGSEGSEEGQFKFPRGVAVDDQGYIFIGDSGNNRIQIFQPDGTFLKSFGSWGNNDGEFKGLEGLAVMPNGNIFVCDRENHRIQMF